jgi:hypothetical protein
MTSESDRPPDEREPEEYYEEEPPFLPQPPYDRPPLLAQPLGRPSSLGPPYGGPAYGSPDQPFLRNPFVLGGMVVVFAIMFAVLVALLFGGGGDGGNSSGGGGGDGGSSVIVTQLTPLPGRGSSGQSLSTSTVREGPGLEYAPVGELARNQAIEVIGRNAEASWFEIYYPPGSLLAGWVPDSAIRLDSDPLLIAVVDVTPIARPTLVLPTSTPEPETTPTETPTPTPTGTPTGAPDLAASLVTASCQTGSELIVTVTNLGPGTLSDRAITVLVQTQSGSQQLSNSLPVTLEAGASIDIRTNYVVQEPAVVLVDPLDQLGDADPGNNQVNCGDIELDQDDEDEDNGNGNGNNRSLPPPIVN